MFTKTSLDKTAVPSDQADELSSLSVPFKRDAQLLFSLASISLGTVTFVPNAQAQQGPEGAQSSHLIGAARDVDLTSRGFVFGSELFSILDNAGAVALQMSRSDNPTAFEVLRLASDRYQDFSIEYRGNPSKFVLGVTVSGEQHNLVLQSALPAMVEQALWAGPLATMLKPFVDAKIPGSNDSLAPLVVQHSSSESSELYEAVLSLAADRQLLSYEHDRDAYLFRINGSNAIRIPLEQGELPSDWQNTLAAHLESFTPIEVRPVQVSIDNEPVLRLSQNQNRDVHQALKDLLIGGMDIRYLFDWNKKEIQFRCYHPAQEVMTPISIPMDDRVPSRIPKDWAVQLLRELKERE